jgi:hypothetical protein
LPLKDLLDFLVARFYAAYNFLALELLEAKDLVKLRFELTDEGGFVIVGPRFSLAISAVDEGRFQGVFEVIVGNVVPVVVFDEGLSELLAESDGPSGLARLRQSCSQRQSMRGRILCSVLHCYGPGVESGQEVRLLLFLRYQQTTSVD